MGSRNAAGWQTASVREEGGRDAGGRPFGRRHAAGRARATTSKAMAAANYDEERGGRHTRRTSQRRAAGSIRYVGDGCHKFGFTTQQASSGTTWCGVYMGMNHMRQPGGRRHCRPLQEGPLSLIYRCGGIMPPLAGTRSRPARALLCRERARWRESTMLRPLCVLEEDNRVEGRCQAGATSTRRGPGSSNRLGRRSPGEAAASSLPYSAAALLYMVGGHGTITGAAAQGSSWWPH